MVKPGVEWDPAKEQPPPPPSLLLSGAALPETPSLSPALPGKDKRRGHTRIPSVVLSPTPSSPLEKPQDIQLVDGDGFTSTLSADLPAESSPTPPSTYRTAVSQPEYWQKLLTFLRFVSSLAIKAPISFRSDRTIFASDPSSPSVETRRTPLRTTSPPVKVS
jgi:UV excision repair protein RAD23